jgi:hypothetical protein
MKLFFILNLFFLLLSCGVKEENRPFTEVRTVDEQLKNKVFNIDFAIDDAQVDEYAEKLKIPFPFIGGFFKRSAQKIGNILIGINSKLGEKKIDGIKFNLNELDDVEFDFIDSVVLEFYDLRVKNVPGLGNLSFIKSINVYLDDNPEENSRMMLEQNSSSLYSTGKIKILHYDKDDVGDKISHDRQFSRLRLRSEIKNWKKILENRRDYSISIVVNIEKVPSKTVELEGLVGFNVRLSKLGL